MTQLNFNTEEVKNIIADALKEKLLSAINYGEMHKLVDEVLSERKSEFDSLLNEIIDSFLKDTNIRKAMVEEFRHKVAKTMVSKMDGAVEKNISKFRQDPTTNARMILAIENIISEPQL